MMKNPDRIVIFAHVGGETADDVMAPHIVALSKLLGTHCKGNYNPEVDTILLRLFVDGELDQWRFEGCQRLRRNRKKRYIAVDIGMPRARWEGMPPSKIRKYLSDSVAQAITLCVERLKKDKSVVDSETLFRDYAKVRVEYLK